MAKQIYDDFIYKIVNDEISIEEYRGTKKNVKIPESFNIDGKIFPVTRIANKEAFPDFIESVYIPKTIEFIGLHAFDYTKYLNYIGVDKENKKFMSEKGILYNKQATILIKYPPSKTDKKVLIRDSVKKIKDCAFLCAKNIEEIEMSNKIKEIGFEAFGFCQNLKKVTLSNQIKLLERSLFSYCENLTDINLSDNIETIAASCFIGCTSLKEFIAPSSLKSLGRYAFESCTSIKNIDIKNSKLTYIMDNVFANTTVDTLYLPASIKRLEYNSFGGVKNLYIENPQNFSTTNLTSAIKYLHKTENIIFGSIDEQLANDLLSCGKFNIYQILDIDQLDLKGFSFSQINQILNGYENKINLSLLPPSLEVDMFRNVLKAWNKNATQIVKILIELQDEKDIDKIIENFKKINELNDKTTKTTERVR